MEYIQPASAGGEVLALDASRMVFILVSDMGQAEVEAFMASAASRAGVAAAGRFSRKARQQLLNELRWAISNRTLDAGVDLGAHVHAVIPFMPLTQAAVKEVIRKRLSEWMPRSELWHSVHWDDPTSLAELLSDRAYTKYSVEPLQARTDSRRPAVARGASQATIDGSGSIHVDDTTTEDGASNPLYVCARPMELHAMADYGARALKEGHAGSALDRLYTRLLAALESYGAASAPNPEPHVNDASQLSRSGVLSALQRHELLERSGQLSFSGLIQRGAGRVQSLWSTPPPVFGRSSEIFATRLAATDAPVTEENALTSVVVNVMCTKWDDYLTLAADPATAKSVLGLLTISRCRSIDRRVAPNELGQKQAPVAVQSCIVVYEGPL